MWYLDFTALLFIILSLSLFVRSLFIGVSAALYTIPRARPRTSYAHLTVVTNIVNYS